MIRRLTLLAAVLCLSLSLAGAGFAAAPAAPAGGRVYTYGLWNMLGSQGTQYKEQMSWIINLIFNRMGEKVKVVDMTRDQALKGINNHTIDATALLQADYISLRESGKNIHAVITSSVKGHLNENKCLITLKKAPYTGVSDLRGKKFAIINNIADYLGVRSYFASRGVDEPLDKFFSQVIPYTEDVAAFEAVKSGKADAAIASVTSMNFLKLANATELNKVKRQECVDFPWPGTPVVWVGNPDPGLLKKLYDVLKNATTYPEFKQRKPLFDLMQLQLNFITDRDYDNLIKLYGQAKKKGWIAEYNRIVK